MKFLRGILLPALLALAPFAAAKKDEVVPVETAFDGELVNILYFDDSEIALLAELETGKVWRSADSGKKWEVQEGLRTLGIIKNPFDNHVAVALGEKEHWITYDRGGNWHRFITPDYPTLALGSPISFHAKDSKKMLFHAMENCIDAPCLGATFYTTDGFKSDPQPLVAARRMCLWAKGAELFLKDKDDHDDRILCIVPGRYSPSTKDFRLLLIDDYKFEKAREPTMSSGRTVQGMTNMASVKGYFVAAAKAEHSNELALYVTKDTETWHHAEFGGGKIEEDAYTILESTNYSIQVDVMTSKYSNMGSLYTSNSNGTYFIRNIDHTNRNQNGFVDFEKISNIQGIVMVNVVDNPESADIPFATKKLVSKISFDDGRTFHDLTVKDSDERLHLHSVTNLHNSGRVFSSPAPGLVMGVGNTGKILGSYTDGDLWVSDNAGLTWWKALQEAHKYEFGNKGAVLVAVYDEGDTDVVQYSLKHGMEGSWKEVKLGSKIRARELTTVPDSTSLKFILYGTKIEKGGGRKHVIIHLDFSDLHERACKDPDDFIMWDARQNEKKEALCVMGRKQSFKRRKADVDCFVPEDFKEPEAQFEICPCDEDADYECDYNFKRSEDRKECLPTSALQLPKGACEGGAKTYKGKSGWRKIPGNQCTGSTKKDEDKEWSCSDVPDTPSTDLPTSTRNTFKGNRFREYYYLEDSTQQGKGKASDKDETVVTLTDQREAYISHDHGKTWKKVTEDDPIVAIYPHQYNSNYVYFLTATSKVYYSRDRGLRDSIHTFEAPQMPNLAGRQIMQFHPDTRKSDWIIWVGGKDCEKTNSRECHTVASISQKNGLEWETLLSYVKKCAFVWREAGRHVDEKEVFCEQYTNEEMGAPVELISSKDWFKSKDVKFKSVVEFATMSEFIIVATKGDEGNSLKLDASLDAKTFAEAKFPPKFEVDHQTAYTVLDSSTHSVFLHVTVNDRKDQEYGSIIKSNSNGTSYVMSLNAVNRNTEGYVDFEKMQGIEGVALANILANPKEVDGGATKKKQTRITHNDGADWEPLQAPAKDVNDEKTRCDVNKKDECSLHLHGYTERADPRETFSSPTAVGIMLGVGNIGAQLTTIGEADTFMTTDAGITWKMVMKGAHAWEFGDQGSVIVLVRRGQDTDKILYSYTMGETWSSYQFTTKGKIRVDAITTLPSDTSLNFLLWGKDGKELVAINVDFSKVKDFENKCKLVDEKPEADDYELWRPEHPMSDNKECLFGHVAEYHRKRPDRKCYNGERIDHLHNIAKNCTCTRRDFEW